MKWCECLTCRREGKHPDEEGADLLAFEKDKRGLDGVVCCACDGAERDDTDVMVTDVEEDDE